MSLDRKILMLRVDSMPDPHNVLTWTIGGCPLTSAEVRELHAITLQECEDVVSLMRLDLELEQREGWAS